MVFKAFSLALIGSSYQSQESRPEGHTVLSPLCFDSHKDHFFWFSVPLERSLLCMECRYSPTELTCLVLVLVVLYRVSLIDQVSLKLPRFELASGISVSPHTQPFPTFHFLFEFVTGFVLQPRLAWNLWGSAS